MKKVLLAISLLFLAACRPPQLSQADKSAMQQAHSAFERGVLLALPKLDDQVSDARSIALAATESCLNDYFAMYAPIEKTLVTGTGKRALWARVNSEEEKVAASLPLVLRYRSYLKAKPAPAASSETPAVPSL